MVLPSPAPKSEGPGAPSAWTGDLTGTGATRQPAAWMAEERMMRAMRVCDAFLGFEILELEIRMFRFWV